MRFAIYDKKELHLSNDEISKTLPLCFLTPKDYSKVIYFFSQNGGIISKGSDNGIFTDSSYYDNIKQELIRLVISPSFETSLEKAEHDIKPHHLWIKVTETVKYSIGLEISSRGISKAKAEELLQLAKNKDEYTIHEEGYSIIQDYLSPNCIYDSDGYENVEIYIE